MYGHWGCRDWLVISDGFLMISLIEGAGSALAHVVLNPFVKEVNSHG